MGKSKEQPADPGKRKPSNSQEPPDDRLSSQTESDVRTGSSLNVDKHGENESEESPLSRPKGMDA